MFKKTIESILIYENVYIAEENLTPCNFSSKEEARI